MCKTRARQDYLLPQNRNIFRMSVFISGCAGHMIMNVECQASVTIYSDVMLMKFIFWEFGLVVVVVVVSRQQILIMTCCLLSQVGFS
jgi:hypothetical protein